MSPPTATRRRFRLSRGQIIALIVVGLLVAAMVACQMRPKPVADPYRTATIERGAITKAVAASGTLQALITVDVGSQISGQITAIKVDFNDQVRKGQVMAVIDSQTYQSRLAQGQADVQAGEALIAQAEAQAANARADYERKKTLVAQGIYSPATLDQSKAAFLNADAAVASARARMAQSRAALHSTRVDLGRTTIVAPIDGVVVDRKVSPGQTVAASFTAPVLFTLAQDLSKLQVKISVDEADVGQVHEGQTVRFRVDAYPDDSFQGLVTQVRKQPTVEQNVVAYTVIAVADNPQKKLLPGMTANADIVIEVHNNVLKVPAGALRWKPPTPITLGPGKPPAGNRAPPATAARGKGRVGTVYVLRAGKAEKVAVTVGGTDGTFSEIAGALKVGEKVITGGGPKGRSGAQISIGN